jgi:V/A-type H+-transporting ATPase subunit I
MAKVHMKRIEIITLITDAKSVVERLQRRGVVDLIQYQPTDGADKFEKIDATQSISLFERNSSTVQQALDVLNEYVPEKNSLLSSFSPRIGITTAEFAKMADNTESSMRKAYEIISLDRKIDEHRVNLKSLYNAIEALESWRPLGVPMRFKGTAQTKAFIGTLPGLWDRQKLLSAIKSTPDKPLAADVQIIYSYREQSGIFLLCHKEDEQDCERVLREIGFALPAQMTDKIPAEAIAGYEAEIKRIRHEIESLTNTICKMADVRNQLVFTLDYLSMRIDKYRALEQFAVTRRTLIIEGYVPADKSETLAAELMQKYTICVTVSEPSEQDQPPVAFKNAMPVAAIEDITESYSMPSKDDVDPNPVMAVFYYLFFGLMLSDAGYGLIMTIATALILHFKKPEGNMRRNMQKFMLCGMSTVFWGALFGSWFGDIVSVVSLNFFGNEVILAPIWFNPVNDPMKLLMFSLVLGFIQVVAGLGVKFYMLWHNGNRLDAVLDVGLWWVVFAGIVLIIMPTAINTALPLDQIGIAVASAGAIGLVATQGRNSKGIFGKILGGIGSLYDITGYFSDILSYCRLMALGLVTGIIGSVVNNIGSLKGGGIGGAVMLTLVFIAGHSINLGINALGAYVHCNRLQYVEFFSKFYEGGGRLYSPLRVNTKMYKFKEEHTNV